MKYLIRFFRIFSGPDINDCRRFCTSTQKRESTGEYIDDSVVTTKIKATTLEEASPRSKLKHSRA
ncbi:MAG: hypothetical protein Q7U66_10905 [Methylobacter sp.]|nr:hypothetical protein [Methylobacter sp.]